MRVSLRDTCIFAVLESYTLSEFAVNLLDITGCGYFVYYYLCRQRYVDAVSLSPGSVLAA